MSRKATRTQRVRKNVRGVPIEMKSALPPVFTGTATGVGGVPLHYDVYGEGEPAIVCCNGVGVSTFFWKYVVDYFSATHRVVTWDYRGHNRSGLPAEMTPENFTIELNARDCLAVLDDAGVDRAVFLGHSMGCQVIFELWRQAPERVAGLVPICGPYGRPLDTAFGFPVFSHALFDTLYAAVNNFPEEFEAVLRPLLRSPLPLQIARMGAINGQLAAAEDMQPYFDHLSKMELRVFFLMSREMQNHDAGPWLEQIDAPTLVVAGEHDVMTPLALAHEMTDRIPGAELLVLPKGSHAGLIEHPELLNLRLEKFLRERVDGKPVKAGKPKPGGKARNAKDAKKPKPAKKPAKARKRAAAKKKDEQPVATD
jgi:pimeloyl-ACP methyl ester carboxylesterase